ncbi:MAG: MFS transporter [Austwickia sp.]|nr:MFS transporter [Austwickia sp.]MBK8437641.1 MFS transporter [Austwickia sp.]MBK9102911.1 MFS transporter [Austwickia sp.]
MTHGVPADQGTSATPNLDEPLTHAQIVTILTGLMLGMFLAALDQTIVASAMRVIADDLNNLQGQAWATTAYLVTSTIVTPLYGKISDIYGRKPLFSFAIGVFILGSMLCTLAASMPMLAAFRAVQGLGAGGLFSLALAIIGDIVPARERSRYQGYFMAVFGTSSVLGPVVGGFFAQADTILGISGWRWVFLINVPIGIAALIVVARTLHLQHQRLDHRIDWWGAAALSVAVIPLLLLAENGREWGWTSVTALTYMGIGLAGLVAFLSIERAMGEEAILPLRLFAIKTVGVSSVSGVLLGMAMFGGMVSIPLYLQIVKGASPMAAGLMMLPMTLGIMSGSLLTGRRIATTGRYRHWPMIGLGLLAVAMFLFHYVHYDTSLILIMILMTAFGFGLGLNMQTLTLAVQNAVSPRDIGVATSSATFMRQVGGTLGTAVFLSVLFSSLPGKIAEAMTTYGPTNPAFREALARPSGDPAANAAFLSSLKAGGGTGAGPGMDPLQDSSFLNLIDPRLAKPFLVGFAESMDLVFLLGSVVALLAFLWTLQLPHVELRTASAYQQRRDDAAGATGTGPTVPL